MYNKYLAVWQPVLTASIAILCVLRKIREPQANQHFQSFGRNFRSPNQEKGRVIEDLGCIQFDLAEPASLVTYYSYLPNGALR